MHILTQSSGQDRQAMPSVMLALPSVRASIWGLFSVFTWKIPSIQSLPPASPLLSDLLYHIFALEVVAPGHRVVSSITPHLQGKSLSHVV